MNWIDEIFKRLKNTPEGEIWCDNETEILCKTESAANAIADLLEQLYESQGEEILVNTGYYDSKEDQRNGEEDKYSGYWYVTVN